MASTTAGAGPFAFRAQANTAGRLLGRAALAAAGLGLVIGVWALLAAASSDLKVPTPGEVFSAVGNDWNNIPAVVYIAFQTGGISQALRYTTISVLVAVGVGTAIGVPLGIALARFRRFEKVMEPPLMVLGTMPLLIMLPFITLWFGTARFAQSGLVLIFTVLTVTFAAQAAAQTVSGHYANFAACLGASPARTLWTVVLPAALPDIVGAVRVALAAGWGWQCVAELLGAQDGVGRIIQVTAQIQATTDLFATLLVVAVVAVALDGLVAAAGGFLVRWKEPSHG
jgi:ABC-type nitrate/sulfonate/bicarbonate transport system permease component